MTLTELRYLIALAETKHFGKAAQKCFVSQPTLSIAINKLEKKLGVIIFERLSNEIRITDIGQKIIDQSEQVLKEITVLDDIIEKNKSQLDVPLKIGGIYTIAPYLFPTLIPNLNKIAPNMPLIIEEDFTVNLRHKLQLGQLDALFIATPFQVDGVVIKELYSETLMVLMRKDHPLSQKTMIEPHDLVDETVLLLGKDHCLRDQILAACPQCVQKASAQQTIEGSSLETLRHMVASGLGITLLPNSATQIKHYRSILCVRPFADNQPQRTVALAWRVSFSRTKAIDAIIKALVANKLDGTCLVPDF